MREAGPQIKSLPKLGEDISQLPDSQKQEIANSFKDKIKPVRMGRGGKEQQRGVKPVDASKFNINVKTNEKGGDIATPYLAEIGEGKMIDQNGKTYTKVNDKQYVNDDTGEIINNYNSKS